MSNPLDLDLKLRMRRLFFSQGYWSPIEVELSHYDTLGVGGSVERRSLTDLDVLAIKFDHFFTPHSVVADCKTGRNVSNANRLFWLRGVKDYFGASEAYFVKTSLDKHLRAIGPKMGLRTLSDKELAVMEKAAGVDTIPIPLVDQCVHGELQKLWGLDLPKGAKPDKEQLRLKAVYSHLSYAYWYIERHRNLLVLVGHFESIADLLKPDNKRHVLLAYIAAERIAHAMLEMAGYVQSMGASDIPNYARIYLYGGPLALKDKQKLFDLMRRVTGFNESLDPPWLPHFVELLGRMLSNPAGAVEVPRYLSAIGLCCGILGNPSLPDISPCGKNTAAIVLAKDVATTFSKAAGIPAALFGSMSSL